MTASVVREAASETTEVASGASEALLVADSHDRGPGGRGPGTRHRRMVERVGVNVRPIVERSLSTHVACVVPRRLEPSDLAHARGGSV